MIKLLLSLLLGLQATAGTIQVSVQVAGTSKPIAGVEVTLSGPQSGVATTDASGRAVFPNLPSGLYRIQATREGYFRKDDSFSSADAIFAIPSSAVLRMRSDFPDGLSISVFPNEPNNQLSIAMVPFGSISGRVTSLDGNLLKDVYVSAGVIQYLDGRRVLDEWRRVQTDSKGEYRLPSLAPGEYYVRAEPPNVERGYSGTYYPGETDVRNATWITVRGNDDLGGIDFDVAAPKTYNVSGKVFNAPKRTLPDGRTVSTVSAFSLVPRDASVPDFPFPVQLPNEHPSEDGDFLIKGVPAGSWDLIPVITMDLRAASDQRYIIGRVPIDVIDQDVRDIAVTLDSTSVKGRTRMTGGETVPITLRGLLISRDNTPRNYLGHLTRARTLPFLDGAFTFESVPPGKYSFQFEEVPAGFYLSDIRLGSRSIYDEGIFDVGTTPLESLEIVMGRGGGRVEGKVQGMSVNARSDEYASARVVLVPAKRKNLVLYQVAPLARDGSFSFSYIAPGEYKVFAWKSLPPGAERSNDFVAHYEAFGTSVSVATDVSSNVFVTIIPDDR